MTNTSSRMQAQADTTDTKLCPRCDSRKPLEAFFRDRAKKSGRATYCKRCQKEHHEAWRSKNRKALTAQQRSYRATHQEQFRETKRRYRRRHPDRNRASQKRWQRANPEKRRAYKRVREALEKGLLEKRPCNVCGSKRVQAHHDDYSKSLEVEWLCSEHHAVADERRRLKERHE